MKSEVFEEYMNIMKNGLTKNAQRANINDRTKIEKTYRNEEDVIKYNKNLMQEAHPNKVIFGPSYDPTNSLVENNIERQNIMLNIVNKTPTGQLDYKKYAEEKLKLSLIKVANELDFQNKDKLRVIADNCIDNIIKKQADMLIAGGIAALLAMIYTYQHYPSKFNASNITQSKSELLEAIAEVTDSDTYFLEMFGERFTADTTKNLKNLGMLAEEVTKKCKEIETYVYKYSKSAKSASDVLKISEQESKELSEAFNTFQEFLEKTLPEFRQAARIYSNTRLQNLATEDKGFFTNLVDKAQVLRGGYALFRNKLDEVADKISAFEKIANDYKKLFQEVIRNKLKIETEISSKSSLFEEEKPEQGSSSTTPTTPTPSTPSAPGPTETPPSTVETPPMKTKRRMNRSDERLQQILQEISE